jgi:hypothetical protein
MPKIILSEEVLRMFSKFNVLFIELPVFELWESSLVIVYFISTTSATNTAAQYAPSWNLTVHSSEFDDESGVAFSTRIRMLKLIASAGNANQQRNFPNKQAFIGGRFLQERTW